MKKKPLSRLVAMLLTALVPLLSPAVNTIIYNATYDFNELTLGTDTLGGVTYTTVNYEGLYNGGDPGKPSLPIDYIKLSVPYNATNFTVTATLQNNVIQTLGNLDQLVYPCQPARMMNDTTPVVIVPPDSSVYFSSSYYPGQNAWVVDEGFLAGENHIVTIAVMPVSYKHNRTGNITTNRLRKSQTVRLTLSYSLTDNPAMSPIIRQDTTLRQEGYALTRSMVANPSNVLANAPIELSIDPMDIVNPNSGDGINGGGVDPPDHGGLSHDDPCDPNPYLMPQIPYLIITTNDLLHSLRRLAALKRQKGYNVKIVTMDEVLTDSLVILGDRFLQPDGSYYVAYNDDAGKLRQYLKYAFRYWGTQYVFFVGDSIPYRTIDAAHNSGEIIVNIPTDLYLSDLNGDWSAPLNVRKIDYSLDLYVGRLLSKTEQENSNYIDKLFRYELNPGNGQSEYLSKILYSEGLDMQKDGEVAYVHNVYSKLFNDSIHIKESNNEQYPSGTEIINRLNTTPVGYMSFFNHAGPGGFISYGHRSYFPDDTVHFYLWAVDTTHIIYNNIIYNKDKHLGNGFNNLTNKCFPSICYSIGCTTMPYDQATNYENVLINLGHSFTTGKDYGGPAFLGNTREGVTENVSTDLERLFALQINKGFYKIGVAEALCKQKGGLNRAYVSIIHNLLGDPEFEIWTDIPNTFNNVSIIRTDDSIAVSNINGDSVIVAYTDLQKYFKIQLKTVSSSSVFNNVSPNGTIMLYRHNYIPYIAPLVLQNYELTRSQYLIASDVTAGYAVDEKRKKGEVIVKDGVEYEIEASGTVTLCDGFEVEKGATFAVYPSTF